MRICSGGELITLQSVEVENEHIKKFSIGESHAHLKVHLGCLGNVTVFSRIKSWFFLKLVICVFNTEYKITVLGPGIVQDEVLSVSAMGC